MNRELPSLPSELFYGELKKGRYDDFAFVSACTVLDCGNMDCGPLGHIQGSSRYYLFNLPRYLSRRDLDGLMAASAVLTRSGSKYDWIDQEDLAIFLGVNGCSVYSSESKQYEWEQVYKNKTRLAYDLVMDFNDRFFEARSGLVRSMVWSAMAFLMATVGKGGNGLNGSICTLEEIKDTLRVE